MKAIIRLPNDSHNDNDGSGFVDLDVVCGSHLTLLQMNCATSVEKLKSGYRVSTAELLSWITVKVLRIDNRIDGSQGLNWAEVRRLPEPSSPALPPMIWAPPPVVGAPPHPNRAPVPTVV